MSMIESALNGKGEPAKGILGRVLDVKERDAAALTPELLTEQGNIFREVAKAGSVMPKWVGAQLGETKKQVPELADAGGRHIARVIADDYQHLANVVQAKKEGRYLEFKSPEGMKQQGIVSGAEGALKREGQWVQKDPTDKVRQIANFKDGLPHGTYRNYRENGTLQESGYFQEGIRQGKLLSYNDEGKPTKEIEYKDGQQFEERVIDPQKSKEAREAMQAMRRIGIGRKN